MNSQSATVIGLSIAGISAALRLADAGQGVNLFEIENDLALREQFEVSGTALANDAIRGADFEDIARSVLAKSGIALAAGIVFQQAVPKGAGLGLVVKRGARELEVELERSSKVIYSPNGVPLVSPLLEKPNFSRALGRGLSMSASADASFFKGRKAAVIGNSRWTVEQARFAAEFASVVKIIVEGENLISGSKLIIPGCKEEVEVIPHSHVIDLKVSAEGKVLGIIYETPGGLRTDEIDVVFLATDIQPDWGQVGGEETARKLNSQGVLCLSGVANSIPYNAYAELAEDGIRAAQALLLD